MVEDKKTNKNNKIAEMQQEINSLKAIQEISSMKKQQSNNILLKVGQVLIIIVAILWCITLIGMAWGIPMIIGSSRRMKGEKEVTVAHIVIAFLFFGWLGALLTLLSKL